MFSCLKKNNDVTHRTNAVAMQGYCIIYAVESYLTNCLIQIAWTEVAVIVKQNEHATIELN